IFSFLEAIRTASNSIRSLLILIICAETSPNNALSRNSLSTCLFTRNNSFHNLCSTIANLETQYIAHALFHDTTIISGMTKGQQTLMNYIIGQLRSPPFTHSSLGGVWQMIVFQP